MFGGATVLVVGLQAFFFTFSLTYVSVELTCKVIFCIYFMCYLDFYLDMFSQN